jgi:Ankyrin repeats (3 copies)
MNKEQAELEPLFDSAEVEVEFPEEMLSRIQIPHSLPKPDVLDRFSFTKFALAGELVPFLGCLSYWLVGLALSGHLSPISLVIALLMSSLAAALLGPFHQLLRDNEHNRWMLASLVIGSLSGLAAQFSVLLVAGTMIGSLSEFPNQAYDLVLCHILLYPQRVVGAILVSAGVSALAAVIAKRNIERKPWASDRPRSRRPLLALSVFTLLLIAISVFSFATLPSRADRRDNRDQVYLANAVLGEAVRNEDWSTLERLLACEPDAVDWHFLGSSPLNSAQSVKMMAYLLQHGGDINVVDVSRATPLGNACMSNKLEMASFLLEQGADPNAGGLTPLSAAAINGNVELLKLLLKNGAKPNDGSTLPLHVAASRGHLEFVKILLQEGADPSLVRKEKTALDHAQEKGQSEIVELLESVGRSGSSSAP